MTRGLAADPRSALRQKALQQRRALSREQVTQLSQEIAQRFLAQPEIQKTSFKNKKIALYHGTADEPDLSRIEEFFLSQGAQLLYPRVTEPKLGVFEVVRITRPQTMHWVNGYSGILEPAAHLPPEDPAQLDLIFVPGALFSEKGERIGMGGGFYDRFLPRSPKAMRVAPAFELQLRESLPQSEWDQPVHWIITEKRDIRVPTNENSLLW